MRRSRDGYVLPAEEEIVSVEIAPIVATVCTPRNVLA
jgi:hypothetical protein